MKIPRDVSGARLATSCAGNGSTRGCTRSAATSYWKLPSLLTTGIAIPDHHPLGLGTLTAILRDVARHKAVQRDSIIAGL